MGALASVRNCRNHPCERILRPDMHAARLRLDSPERITFPCQYKQISYGDAHSQCLPLNPQHALNCESGRLRQSAYLRPGKGATLTSLIGKAGLCTGRVQGIVGPQLVLLL